MRSREREIRKLIEKAQLRCVELAVTGGNHYVARVEAAKGVVSKFIFSASPSDHRADKNRLALLRRFAAEHAG